MTAKVLDLLAEQIANADTAWSIGTFGAIAEFMREPNEPIKISRGLNALWNKGGLQYAPPIR